jgi:hypothetical protein
LIVPDAWRLAMMRTHARLFAPALVAASLSACTVYTLKDEQPLPLQVQAYQTREFEIDKTLAMSSVISVFQDLGYIIQSADKDVGFVTATSPTREQRGFLGMKLILNGSLLNATSQTRATAVLEEIRPGFTTVRLNFVVNSRSGSDKGFVSETDAPVTEPEPYSVAFNKIEEAIFVRAQARGSTPPPAGAGQTPAPAAQPAAAGQAPRLPAPNR